MYLVTCMASHAGKLMILRDYFELSGQSIHETAVEYHFLTIPGVFGTECSRNIAGISIGIFSPLIHRIINPLREIST